MFLYNRNSYCHVLRLKGIYEPQTTAFVKKTSSKIFVDVGANIGYFSLLASYNTPSVYAFEPEPVNFQILERNVNLNHIANIKTYKCACGSHNSTAFLKKTKRRGDHYITEQQEVDTIIVSMVRLDTVIPRDESILMKIDVEGYEDEVILGSLRLLEDQVDNIIIEYNQNSWENVKRILFDLNFQFQRKLDRNLLFSKL